MTEPLTPAQQALEEIIALADKEFRASEEYGYASTQHCAATLATQDLIATSRQFRSDYPAELLLHFAVLELAAWRHDHEEKL